MDVQCTRTAYARSLFLICLLIGFASIAFAQAGRGSISGLVTDTSGAIIPGAKVVAQSQATDLKLSTMSTASGLYSFVSLAPGEYQVTASAKGFETLIEKNITVSVVQVSTINLTLKVGSVSEVVTVNGATELVEASNSTVGQLITADTIDRVPMLTRNVFDLIPRSAVVTPATAAA